MTQIYSFDDNRPPVITEKILRTELARRNTLKQTVLLVIAGMLSELCLLIAALILYPINAALSLICFAYVGIAISGSIVIAFAFTYKGGNGLWFLHHSYH